MFHAKAPFSTLLLLAGLTLPPVVHAQRATNILTGSVSTFDSSADYFADKATVRHATGFAVSYHGHYKKVTVTMPWQGAKEAFTYVLVQRGTPVPRVPEASAVFTVPAERFIALSTTYLPQLRAVGGLDALVGLGTLRFANTPEVVAMVRQGKLVETGSDARMNLEVIVNLRPDVVMTYAFGDPGSDAHPKLLEAGIPVAVNGEYMETSPLGRTEWMKFTALFLNREAAAEEVFDDVERRYEALAAKGRAAADRPTVFTGTSWQGTWHVAGGRSYTAAFLRDAGARYVFDDIPSSGSVPMELETVLDRAQKADYWLNTSDWSTLSQVVTADERYASFSAYASGRIYNRVALVNEAGGNDYWESGLASPHVVLADLLKIFHPELAPDHRFVYYLRLAP